MLFLLAVANGMPILARDLCGERLGYPVDGGYVWRDGRPLLGPSKTIRGVVVAIIASSVLAPWVGLPLRIGTLIGCWAMLGDLVSSFLKRRLGIRSSDSALGLDQGLESLCPAFALRRELSLQTTDIFLVVAGFFLFEIVISRLLYWLHIRNRPL